MTINYHPFARVATAWSGLPSCAPRITLRHLVHLDLLRSFFEIVAHGSLNKAAAYLRVSQSTLTRQLRALETEIGGALVERGPGGIALTASGHALVETMRPVLARFDAALGEVRKLARGQSASLRIGYIMSAAREYLNPALAALRRAHPEVKVKLLDLSPGEQVEALRRGTIDLALLGLATGLLDNEFYVKRLGTLPVVAALSETHPLAGKKSISLPDLKREVFVGAPDRDLPGYNRWIMQAARKAGFRARIVENADSLTHGLALVVTEGAVSLIPDYAKKIASPGVVFRPLRSPAPTWTLLAAWQRGKTSAPVRALLDALPAKNTR